MNDALSRLREIADSSLRNRSIESDFEALSEGGVDESFSGATGVRHEKRIRTV
ncbi:hypothetical protein [Natronorarus salvus]|uniref:hypothetical protein n=1 Tax=Natronorarus salvus TaxID=3117733 RepID=UPI002F260A83